MAIKLREGERIESEAHLHWLNYVAPSLWAFVWLLAALGAAVARQPDGPNPVVFLCIGLVPAAYVFLKNYCKSYVITDQRLYVEEGILAKSRRDIPLGKINDFEAQQGLLQRLFGAGNIHVLTGNNKPTVLKNIGSVEVFREAASSLISNKKAG